MMVIDQRKLQSARQRRLQESIKEMALFAKKATDPVERVALSELEQALMNLKTEWRERGLLPTEEDAS